jgi:hypothetical protein
MNELLTVVDDLRVALGTTPVMSRRLASNLWFVFTQMLAQADHTRAPEPILRAAWEYEGRLEELNREPLGSPKPGPVDGLDL